MKKKRFLTVLAGSFLALSVVLATLLGLLPGLTVNASANADATGEWTNGSASPLTAEYEESTGYFSFGGLTQWGDRLGHGTKVKVDGLTVDLYSDKFADGDRFGFSLVKNLTDYSPLSSNFFNAVFIPGLWGQTRLGFLCNSDPDTQYEIASSTPGGAIGDAFISSKVFNYTNDPLHAKLTFHKYNDDYYQVDFSSESAQCWGDNVATVYVSASYFNAAMDEDGYAYLSAFHGYGTSSSAHALKIRYEDDILRAAKADIAAYASAVSALEAEITTENYQAMLAAKAKAEAYAGKVSELSAGNYTATLTALRLRALNAVQAQDTRFENIPGSDWTFTAKKDAFGDGTETVFNEFKTRGERMVTARRVRLDGLQIELYSDRYTAGDRFGISFVGDKTDFGPDLAAANRAVFNATFMAGIYPGQSRFNIGKTDDDQSGIAKTTATGDINTGAFVSSMVYDDGNNAVFGARLTFTELTVNGTTVYRIDYVMTAGTNSYGTNASTVYVDGSFFENAVDAYGYTYISVFHGYGESAAAPAFRLRYTEVPADDTAVEKALTAYEAFGAATKDNLVASIAARTAAEQALQAFPPHDERYDAFCARFAAAHNASSYARLVKNEYEAIREVDFTAKTITTDAEAFFTALTDAQTLEETATPVLSAAEIDEIGLVKDGLLTQKAALEKPIFNAMSLVLSGELGVNFYIYLPAAYRNAASALTATAVNTETNEVFDIGLADEYGRFRFTAHISAIEMADDIVVVFRYGDGETVETTANVQTYLRYIIENAETYGAETVKLAKAIADYGHYAQIALAAKKGFVIGEKYQPIDAGNETAPDADRTIAGNDIAVVGSMDNLHLTSFSISLGYNTSVNLFFTWDGEQDALPVVTVGGEALEVHTSGERYYVTVDGISAHQIGDTYDVRFGDDMTVSLSVLSYIRALLASSETTEMKQAGVALYQFYEAALAYKAAPENK